MAAPHNTQFELCDHCIHEVNNMLPIHKQLQQQGFDGYCFKCGAYGHVSRHCDTVIPKCSDNQGNVKINIDAKAQMRYIPFTNQDFDPKSPVNAQNYQVTPFGKPKLTQTVQSEYLLGDGHVNDFNERINSYSQQLSQELSKQNIVIVKGMNTLGKKISKWAPSKQNNNNNKRFAKANNGKMVKFADKNPSNRKDDDGNDSTQDKAKQVLTNVMSQTQQIKHLLHFTSDDEDSVSANNDQDSSNTSTGNGYQSQNDDYGHYQSSEGDSCNLCPGTDNTSAEE